MTEAAVTLEDRGPVLLGLARAAIASALGRVGRADRSAPWLREKGACFVTLTQDGNLSGCVGSIEAHRSLLEDVTANARAAAFADPRFPPLGGEALERARIEVSLLSPTQQLHVCSEAEALQQIRPHLDGLVLQWGRHCGAFLPQVWEALPDPSDFLAHLKRKAGLPHDFWVNDLRLYRYCVTKWSEPETGQVEQ
ncbi:AmmeMemoRadiSam system protein A [Rhodoblastus sp. 17X3]|uniref:AmmeMemoRadiSam system protein A n=1 Tax=Rhodoblastus sp. 17X3 TaxID=3047026 RepID=UPI0024B64DF0|nr:AmmeMemoRadiSam system protein A [Rhodoblastus sp. 17X3]MDI9849157.1 AmmeMemoRadiSam system protein A [Rhodoblastus sp. 17X3]